MIRRALELREGSEIMGGRIRRCMDSSSRPYGEVAFLRCLTLYASSDVIYVWSSFEILFCDK